MSIKGRLVSAFYKSEPGKYPSLYYVVRDLENKKVFVEPISSPIRPYFYIKKEQQHLVAEFFKVQQISNENYKFIDSPYEFALDSGKAVKCELWEPWRVGGIRKALRKQGIEVFEADIPFIRRINIDLNIKMGIEIDGQTIKPYDGNLPKPKLLFVDSEFDDLEGFPEVPGQSACIAIGTTDENGVEKYYTWEYGESTEAKMFSDFFNDAKEYDFIVVWNKDFEEKQIPARCKELNLWYEWRIFRWIDLADYFRMYNLETHFEKLPMAYGRMLKKFEPKLIKAGIVIKHERIERLPSYYNAWKNDPERLKEVNSSHSYALYIMEKGMEAVSMYSDVADEVGIFMDFTAYNSHIVDTAAMRLNNMATKKWIISSSREYDDKKKGFKGAVVFPAKRGVHSFVFLFDFTSLYNKIIQSYLLDPIAYYHWKGSFAKDGIMKYKEFAYLFGQIFGVEVDKDEKTGEIIKLPIFPALLAQLEKRRNYFKNERKKYHHGTAEYEMYDSKQKATKVILLACYGVLGMSSSRWEVIKEIPIELMLKSDVPEDQADYRIPNEAKEKFVGMVTHIARTALISSKDFFELEQIIEAIYGDTDSNFIRPKGIINENKTYKDLTEEDLKKLKKFGDETGSKLEKFFSENFEEGIEMKLEKIFDRGVFGKVKKQYYCRAIWDEDTGWQKDKDGKITWYEYTKGLPLVRTDRTEFLKRMQRRTLLTMLDNPDRLLSLWLKTVKDYYQNKYDHELILRIGIKKRLDQYKNITPAVRAARKMERQGYPIRPGEKVAFIVTDIVKGVKVSEPVDETLLPRDAIAKLPKLSKKALDYYWNDRIWKNIYPFLELVLTEKEIQKIENACRGLSMIDQWL